MANFSFLNSFKLQNENDPTGSNLTHNFYPVTLKDILEAEQRLGFTFPDELDEFYKQIGYGFFYHKKEEVSDINRFIDPSTVADIHLREDFYEYDSDLDIYSDSNRLIFFEVNEGVYLSISLHTSKQSAIYFVDQKIADSLEEVVLAISQNPTYLHQFDEE